MLYLVGLGLGDVKDITVKGLEIVKSVDEVYLEAYTSILCSNGDHSSLEEFYGRKVNVADRNVVECGADLILNAAVNGDVAFLVVGDPFGATTHTDLVLRAIQRNIPYKVIHNTSILNAVGCCGLQLYTFGETVSIPFWTETWKPESFVDKIINNLKNGFHTLCLLDIKVKEKSLEALMRGKEVYDEPRFMTVDVAAKQILDVVERRNAEGIQELTPNSLAIGLARVGSDDQVIKCCTLTEMSSICIGKPLHCLIIAGKLHPLEDEMLSLFKTKSGK